jgi:hypothetical protein
VWEGGRQKKKKEQNNPCLYCQPLIVVLFWFLRYIQALTECWRRCGIPATRHRTVCCAGASCEVM